MGKEDVHGFFQLVLLCLPVEVDIHQTIAFLCQIIGAGAIAAVELPCSVGTGNGNRFPAFRIGIFRQERLLIGADAWLYEEIIGYFQHLIGKFRCLWGTAGGGLVAVYPFCQKRGFFLAGHGIDGILRHFCQVCRGERQCIFFQNGGVGGAVI